MALGYSCFVTEGAFYMGLVDSIKDTLSPADNSAMDWNKIDWNKIDQERFLPKIGQKKTIPDAERLELACKESEDGVRGVVVEVYSIVDGPLKNKVIDVLPVYRWPDDVEINPEEFKSWLDSDKSLVGNKATIDSCFKLYGEISGVLYRYEEFYAMKHNGSSTGLEMDERGSKYIAEYNRWMYKSVNACKKACRDFLEYKYGNEILQEELEDTPQKAITREEVSAMIEDFFTKEGEKQQLVEEENKTVLLNETFNDKELAEKVFDSFANTPAKQPNSFEIVSQPFSKENGLASDVTTVNNASGEIKKDNVDAMNFSAVNSSFLNTLGSGFVESIDENETKSVDRPTVQVLPKSEKLEQEFSTVPKKFEPFPSSKLSVNQNEELISDNDKNSLKHDKAKADSKSKSESFRIWVRPELFQKGYSGILVLLEKNMYAHIPEDNFKVLINSEKFKNWAIVYAKNKDFSFRVCNSEKEPTDFSISISSLRKQLDKQQLKSRLATHKNFQQDCSTEVGER